MRALLFLTCLGLCGCFGHGPPPVRYYTLSLAPLQQQTTTEVLPGAGQKQSLRVLRFAARNPYAQERLVYRTTPYQVEFYNYHAWASLPSEQVGEWTVRYLRQAGLFSRVSSFLETPGDLDLGGVVREMEEVDRPTTWEASLAIDFWLSRSGEPTPFWFHSYEAHRTAARRNPEAIAEAMSQNLQEILGQLRADLEPVLRTGR